LVVEPEPVDLEEFLLHQYQINRSIPWPAAVEFQLELAPSLPTVLCDPIRVQQVVTNLIANAIKYTQQGSVTLSARIDDEDKNSVLIGIRDTGIGIAEDDLERVFNRFEQVSETGKRLNGLGLGLAICKELIDHHNGRIWVESTLGQGSDFKFTLPVAQ
jgi:signal transduction histidine kinase